VRHLVRGAGVERVAPHRARLRVRAGEQGAQAAHLREDDQRLAVRSRARRASAALQSPPICRRYTVARGNHGEASPAAIHRHSGGNGTRMRVVPPKPARKWTSVLLTPTYSSTTASSASAASRSAFTAEKSCTGAPIAF